MHFHVVVRLAVVGIEGSSLPFCRREGRRLRVNIMSETSFWGLTTQGGHTGFLDCVDLMRGHPDLEVTVNDRAGGDVLHSHSWGPYYLACGRGYRGRRVHTAHAIPESAEGALPFMFGGTRALVRGYLKRIYQYSDIVVAVSPRSAESLRRLGVTSAIAVVPNPVRAERFYRSPMLGRAGRAMLGVGPEERVVLGVGQLQPRKGVADFVAVARSCPEARFVWVGARPFGVVSAGIRALRHERMTAPPNLSFAGAFDLTEMPKIYNAADVLLFPSLQENSPYAPIEAAACGVPVIFRALPDYEGLYCEAISTGKDVAEFTRRVRRLLGDATHRRAMQERSRRLATAFDSTTFVERMATLYDCLARGVPLDGGLRDAGHGGPFAARRATA